MFYCFSSFFCLPHCVSTDTQTLLIFQHIFYMWKKQHRWLVLRVLHLFIYSFSVEHLREMKTKQVCLFGIANGSILTSWSQLRQQIPVGFGHIKKGFIFNRKLVSVKISYYTYISNIVNTSVFTVLYYLIANIVIGHAILWNCKWGKSWYNAHCFFSSLNGF